MSYTLIEERVQTLLQALSRFAGRPEDITRADYRILENGIETDTAIVFEPGSVILLEPEETHSGYSSIRKREYDVLLTLFMRLNDYPITIPLFAIFRDEVLTQIENYPSLNGLVIPGVQRIEYINMSSEGDPYGVPVRNSTPLHVAQDFRIRYRIIKTLSPNVGH
jgi:hypothetical protein